MDKFTKIVCTLGPATDTYEKIEKLYKSGMNVARLNFSHGSFEYFEKLIKTIRQVSPEIAILLDTKGPEIRTGEIENDEIELKDRQKIIFTKKQVEGNNKLITINYEYLEDLKIGNEILIDDGLIGTKVVKKLKNGDIEARVKNTGKLSSRKTVTIIGHNVKIPFLSKKDIEDIKFAIKHNLDFIAASFVREAKEVKELKAILEKNKSKIQIISKIEHQSSVDNFDKILDESDGIMVARGDLGVEIPPEKVPFIQRDIIKKCRTSAKPVIVATHMLESMKENPRPTRAEVSDVAQAIMQGTDAIMLSGETASGKYPVESVKMMTRIAKEYDNKIQYQINSDLNQFKTQNQKITQFITNSAYHAARDLGAKAILIPTATGFTARGISRFRPSRPIFAATNSMTILRQLQIVRNVKPFCFTKGKVEEKEKITSFLIKETCEKKHLKKGDMIVITSGLKEGEAGYTNKVEVLTL